VTANLKVETQSPTPSQLVDALNLLGVSFLRGGSGAATAVAPGELLAALAASAEARLRLALIPLLLAHPEFAVYVPTVCKQLPTAAAVTLCCYYTAAHWLQRKHHARLLATTGSVQPLPDLFGAELGLVTYTDPDAALHALAARQQALSERVLNWFGTYEHALQTWLRQLDHDAQWNRSHPSRSMHS
jgi:hypothetical protein